MLHVLEHAFIESLKVFAFVFVLYFLLCYVEKLINKKLSTNSKLSPLFGSLLGLIPQCGVSVAASDLYLKRKITIGTLVSIFLACSDEAVFILLASEKALAVIPLLISKLVIGFSVGFILDYLIKSKIDKKEEVDVHCCHHEHSESKREWINDLTHNFFHALEIFAYVLVVNIIIGTIVHFVGENNLILFFENNKYLNPLFATLIGLIPNCASSIILSDLYIINGLSYGALLAGLSMNSGLGLIYLLKDKDNRKNSIYIIILMLIVSIVIGYLTCLLIGF